MNKYDTLYHVDENENIRVWWMEQDGDKYRTVSGIEGGQLVTSEWKVAKPKNVGRANATTAEDQAFAEINSQYTKKLDRKYSRTKETASKSNIIEPMLAATYKGWDFDKWGPVYSQPKLDGMRCLATKDGLFSRQGKRIVSAPHIENALKPYFIMYPHHVLDGELYNHKFRDNFNELISIARQMKPSAEDIAKSMEFIQYHVYDIIFDDTFQNRWEFLLRHMSWLSGPVQMVQTEKCSSQEELDEHYASFLSDGYEGQMIRQNKPYEQKRSKYLLKRKEFVDEEFEVLDILEGQGNWSGYAKSVQCVTKEGVVFNAGIKGTQEFTKALLTRSPRPKTATVRYQNKTPDGSLRFPIAVAFYENERDI